MASAEVVREIGDLLSPSGLEFHQTDNQLYKNVVFGDITDNTGNPIAFFREYLAADELSMGLEALRGLGVYGVDIVNHMPVVLPSGLTIILTDYVDGPTLDEAEVSEETYLDLATRLSRYYVDRYLGREPFLVDITDPYQYKAIDGKPILIDIDMHLVPECSDEAHFKMAKEHVVDIGQVYNPLLGYDNGHLLANHLQMMHRELRVGTSLSSVAV